jgi:predicted secreted hydrolase
MKIFIAALALLLVSGLVLVQYSDLSVEQEISARVQNVSVEQYSADGFQKAYEVIDFEFPRDHGPHPDFQGEWWYYTGNLADAAGNRYGYQFTIFRRAILPGEPARESEWSTRQIYFAHFTVTDVSGQSFEAHERYSRAGAGLAGAQAEPIFHVWIDDWFIKEITPGQVQLKAGDGNIGIDLRLESSKPVVLQGNRGLSPKSNEPGNASYYYSLTHNPTTGTITTPRGAFAVSGKSWMDREWSTSFLGDEAVGWDWFSLQLDDNREVMFYLIRLEDGGVEPVSAGVLVEPDGSVRRLHLDDVEIEPLGSWTSPHSKASYPAEWNLRIPAANIDLHLKPLLQDQELNLTFTYWEGAVRVTGSQTGYGYVELTGYAGSMRGRT